MDKNEGFGPDYYTLTDENGQEYQMEHLDTIELDGSMYLAFLPADLSEDDPEYGIVLLKYVEENGEGEFENLTDEEEDRVYEAFMERLFSEEEDE